MKALVTGGAGFIGSHTADLLLKKGHQVRILDSLEPPVHQNRQKPSYVPADAEFYLGDVRDKNDVEKALRGVDAVFHLAAYQGYLTDFSNFAAVNDTGTALLYEIIVNNKLPIKKVVLASSQAVYGEGKYNCRQHGVQFPPLRELEQLKKGEWELHCPVCAAPMTASPSDESTAHPHNQYGVSKYAQELYALTLGRRFEIPTVAMRYSIAFGPRQSFANAYSGILRIFSVRMLQGLAPVIYEDGKQLRDYVSVDDVARANVLVLEDTRANYQAYNVGGGTNMTVLDFTRKLGEILNKDIKPEIKGTFRFGDTRHVFSDISKLQGLGWRPAMPLEQSVRDYIAWVREQPHVTDYYDEAEKVMKEHGVIRSRVN